MIELIDSTRLCACGECDLLAPPGALFIRGHHVRLMARDSNGRVLKIHIEELPICACGTCGERVQKRDSRFRRGHNKRAALVERLEAMCRNCDRSIPYAPYDPKPLFCRNQHRCQIAYERNKRKRPQRELGRFIFEQWRISRSSLSAFARQHGVTRQILTDMLDDRLPTQRTLDRLTAAFDDLPPSETETTRRQHDFPNVLSKYGHLGRTKKAQRKSAKKRTGLKRSPEAVASVVAALEAKGVIKRLGNNAKEHAQTNEGKAQRTLTTYLRWHPQPTNELTRQWADQVALRLDVCIGEVIGWWNPRLEKRRLPRLGGHPAEVETCDQACKFLDSHPWTGRQRPHGYWNSDGAPEGGQSWCEGHSRGCPQTATPLRHARNSIRTPQFGLVGRVQQKEGLSV